MESDPTQPSFTGPHPSLQELRTGSRPEVAKHVESCEMCRSVVEADAELDAPIPLDLPKGLVSEAAFRWPADPIARGGMAQIFAAEDRRLGRTVILKAPREGDDLPAGMADMFQRRVSAEARVLAKLQHPSIVTIYELGRASVGWPFCVLERVDGDSLRDRLDELAELELDRGRPCTRERLELLSNLVGIAEALAYAHEHRVVHRDVTPNNILLGKRGEATLIDWGIARDLDAPGGGGDPTIHDEPPSISGRMVTISAGTPPYLPLEQSQGRRAAPSFDVYSFGVTLYEVVAGKTPFEWRHVPGPGARTAQIEAFLAWLQSDVPVAPAMPRDPELSGIIARAMAREPSQRFTADELVRALKQYLTGDLVFSHRYSLTGRLARWTRRHRAAAVATIFIALSGVVGALGYGYWSKQKAQLEATAASARANASEKQRLADQANHEAEQARLRAEQAEKRGENANELRRDADRKRRAADDKRHAAEIAANQAKGTAEEATKKFEEAMREKDDADREREIARADKLDADRQRDAALAARDVADRERDAARAARAAADRERDVAKQAAVAAEADRDRARTGQTRAEQERDAAVAARAGVERERDDARRRIAELEAKLRELERGPPPPPPPPPP